MKLVHPICEKEVKECVVGLLRCIEAKRQLITKDISRCVIEENMVVSYFAI